MPFGQLLRRSFRIKSLREKAKSNTQPQLWISAPLPSEPPQKPSLENVYFVNDSVGNSFF